MTSYTPSSKPLKGTGSGSHTWKMQRISAVALMGLSVWFVYFLLSLIGCGYEEILDQFTSPFKATGVLLFLTVSFYHGWLGVKEVLEDYLQCPLVKGVMSFGLLFGLVILYGLGVASILKLFLG